MQTQKTRVAFKNYRTRAIAVLLDLPAPQGEYVYMNGDGEFDTAPAGWFATLRPATMMQAKALHELLYDAGIDWEFTARVA